MKTTIEIPASTLMRARSVAVSRGISLKQFFTKALEDKLKAAGTPSGPPAWMKLAGAFGKTASDRAETRRIRARIDRDTHFDSVPGVRRISW